MSFIGSIYIFLFLNLWAKSTQICLTSRGEKVSLVNLKTNLCPMEICVNKLWGDLIINSIRHFDSRWTEQATLPLWRWFYVKYKKSTKTYSSGSPAPRFAGRHLYKTVNDSAAGGWGPPSFVIGRRNHFFNFFFIQVESTCEVKSIN